MTLIDDRLRPFVERVWNYHQLDHDLVRSDAILVLCSHDTRVAEYAAQLFLDSWAPRLIFSGGLGAITKGLFDEPEADRFAGIAIGLGVPADSIIIENQSTNTGENVQFTRQLLAARAIDWRTFILVQKPYMERRAFATFRKMWPEPSVCVTSPRVSLDQYLGGYANDTLSAADVVSIMVGDCSGSSSIRRGAFRFRNPFRMRCGSPSASWWRPATTATWSSLCEIDVISERGGPMRMRALIATSLTLAAAVLSAEPMTTLERQRLVAHMEMTARWLEDRGRRTVAGAVGLQAFAHRVVDPRSPRPPGRGRSDLLEEPAHRHAGECRASRRDERR